MRHRSDLTHGVETAYNPQHIAPKAAEHVPRAAVEEKLRSAGLRTTKQRINKVLETSWSVYERTKNTIQTNKLNTVIEKTMKENRRHSTLLK